MPMTPEQHEQEMLDRYNRAIKGATDGPKISAIVCPKYYDKPCTLCELTYAYFKAQLGKEHFLREKARSLNRRLNYYSNVIFPANPSEVVIFQYGDELHKILFGYATDKQSEYVGYDNPKTGRNFYVKKDVPGGRKRETKYSVEMRLNATPIPDPSVLSKMHNLDNVLELIETKKARLITQRDLEGERTEMRMLPSWLGPTFRKFYVEVPIHYVNRDEFNAIQDGKVNPFAEAGIKLASKKPEVLIVNPGVPAPDAALPSNWGAWDTPAQTTPPSQDAPKHPCFGTYDANSPLCNDRCMKMGQAEACKAATNQPKQEQSEELRRIAAKLYR